MFGLRSVPRRSTRWSCSSVKTAWSDATGRLRRSARSCGPVLRTSGSTIGTSPASCAERGVAGERVRVHPDAVLARDAARRSSTSRATWRTWRRAGGTRPSRSRSPSSPSVTVSPSASASGFAPLSTLIPGMTPLLSSSAGNGVPSARALADRLVEEDDAADVLLHPRRREEHVAVCTPVLLGRFDPDRVEALLDRAVAFVRGQDPLARRDERARDRLELVLGHVSLLRRNPPEDIFPPEHETSSMPRLEGRRCGGRPSVFAAQGPLRG